eukprot:PITA_07889
MKFTSWNIGGLGSKRKQRMLSCRMKQEMRDMIFIQETKCSIQKLKLIHSKWLNRFEFLEVKAENTVGGILTLWNPQKVNIIDAEASRNYLLVVIQRVGVSETFLVTNVYGPQRIDDRLKLLESLIYLRNREAGIPWIMGELNNDLFTWNNKRGGEAQVASKLDRFMISEELMLIDKEITTRVHPFGGSDHSPIQLEIKGMVSPRNRPFRFENISLSHPDFTSNIERWWSEDLQFQGSKMCLLHIRLKHIKFRLKEWNKKDFGNIFVNKKSLEIKIYELNQELIEDGFEKFKSD